MQPKLPATHMRSLLKKNAKNIIIYWKVANFPYAIILHPLLSILHEAYTYLPVMITKYLFKDVHAKSLEHGLQLWGLRSFIVFVLGLEPRGLADHIRTLSLICIPNPPPRRMKRCESEGAEVEAKIVLKERLEPRNRNSLKNGKVTEFPERTPTWGSHLDSWFRKLPDNNWSRWT